MATRVVVTGGAGFIGRAVVGELLRRGYIVSVVDDLSKEGAAPPVGAHFERIDLTDPERTRVAFTGHDVCINLAAKIGGIAYFHKFPADILAENDRIYAATFRAAAGLRFRRIVFVSSSMVFEKATSFPSHERDVWEIAPPLTAYGFSKLAGEYYCRAFHDQFGLPYTIIRPFNAYGPEELPGDEVGLAHVIPDLIKKALDLGDSDEPLELLGNGEQTRCFTHVRDIARGIVAAMESEAAVNEDFNLSTGEETRIIELARLIHDLCRPDVPFSVRHVEPLQHDIQRRVPAVGKAREKLGWQAQIALRDGLAEVIAAYRMRR
ncbi:MAG: NAD-dependent epimerase/dehydratase family protein [Deltaproteobacteria bacterium]|nr:NAD-dependent epimerase/dehydratase family protein [Deltaproteobacteria bacterium]